MSAAGPSQGSICAPVAGSEAAKPRASGDPTSDEAARHEADAPGAATLAVEIVTEELPPKALKALGTAFADTLAG